MNGSGFILKRGGDVIAAAHKSADPGTGVDGVEHRVIDIHLLLQFKVDAVEVCIGTVKDGPIETAVAAVGDTGCGGIC